jgi:hypothetical protein
VQDTKQRPMADQTNTLRSDHERDHAGTDSTRHHCDSQSSAT